MKIILKQDVPNLGCAGDTKEVKNGYARNFLIPRNLVMRATARSVKEREFLENVQKRKILKRKKTAEEMAKNLNAKEIRITMNVTEGKMFGSVTNILIAKALEADDFAIDKKLILLDEPIKTLGVYDIPVKFYEGIATQIKLYVQDADGNLELNEPVDESEEEKEKTNDEPSVEATTESASTSTEEE